MCICIYDICVTENMEYIYIYIYVLYVCEYICYIYIYGIYLCIDYIYIYIREYRLAYCSVMVICMCYGLSQVKRPNHLRTVGGGISLANCGGSSGENHRKTIGKPWENHRKTMGKWWFNGKTIRRKTIGKP